VKKLITISTAITLCLLCTQFSISQIIHVPGDQATVQAGIDVANTGDTVLVAQGTYIENINFLGKAITVASHYLIDPDSAHINNTVIDGSNPINPDTASVVSFLSGEDTTSILCGFTITGGTGLYLPNTISRMGGGIVCENATAKIIHNIIVNNEVNATEEAYGAGIASFNNAVGFWTIIDDNIIKNNSSYAFFQEARGGGIEVWGNARIRLHTGCLLLINKLCCGLPGYFQTAGKMDIAMQDHPLYLPSQQVHYC